MDLFEYWEDTNEYYDEEPIRYTLIYDAKYFEGDEEGYNRVDYDHFKDALEWYDFFERAEVDVYIKDNWYDVTFSNGEWN